MTDEEIKRAVTAAIEGITREEPKLEFDDVHERSTAHRLAVQMEALFEGWNVDCEYDRDGQVKKALMGIRECDRERATDWVLPDIIVHRRRESGRANNLLVVEIKKHEQENACDRRKLELFTDPRGGYSYQLGLYINISGNRFMITWYKDGAQLPGTEELAFP